LGEGGLVLSANFESIWFVSNQLNIGRRNPARPLALGLGLAVLTVAAARAQTAPPDFTPGLQRVVDFARNGLGDDLILATCVTNAATVYNLSADDIVYLHKQGVSDNVIRVLIETALTQAEATAATTPPAVPVTPVLPVSPASAPSTGMESVPVSTSGLLDNFFADQDLNPGLWQTQSPVLTALGTAVGTALPAALAFTPSGLRVSGPQGAGQFTGVQSQSAFRAPFTFTATVTAGPGGGTPFEIFLVGRDLGQWVSVAGCLDTGAGNGLWVNHTGNSLPVQAKGYNIFDQLRTGVAYTVRLVSGANGAAQVSLLDATGNLLALVNVPVGVGPFYVVLAGRDGAGAATWQTVQLIPTPNNSP
jgi:hypothetical protein